MFAMTILKPVWLFLAAKCRATCHGVPSLSREGNTRTHAFNRRIFAKFNRWNSYLYLFCWPIRIMFYGNHWLTDTIMLYIGLTEFRTILWQISSGTRFQRFHIRFLWSKNHVSYCRYALPETTRMERKTSLSAFPKLGWRIFRGA